MPRTSGQPDHIAIQILAMQAGDLQAFADMYDATSTRVFGLALRILRDQHHAEEVTQETYLRLWQTCDKFDPKRGSGRSWVLTLAHRSAVDRVRSAEGTRRRDAAYIDRNYEVAFDQTSTSAHTSLESDAVRAALHRLTPAQRQAIGLAYFDGLTYREVANHLEVPLGTVKTRIRTGMIRLRDTLAPLRTTPVPG